MKAILTIVILLVSLAIKTNAQVKFDAYISDDVETIKFINLTQHELSDPYMLFYWKLGDGVEKFAGKQLVHNYEAPGTYNITLIGITRSGKRDTVLQSFKIPEDLPYLSEENEVKKKNIAQALSNLKSNDSMSKF